MEFNYRAKKGIGRTIEGTIEEESVERAIERLIKQGFTPISVEPSPVSGKRREIEHKSRRISQRDINIFTRKLFTLTKSRVELLSSLRILRRQIDNPRFKELLLGMLNDIKEGLPLSSCLAKHPEYFSPLYVNIVRSGEASGRLDEALEQIVAYSERIQDLRMKIRQALAYPILMVTVGISTVFVLITFIIPRLASMFEDFEIILPLPTRILLNLGAFLRGGWLWIVLFLILASFLWQRNLRKKGVFQQVKYRIPFLKELNHKQAIVNFSTTLALLLRSGMPVLEALHIATPTLGDKRLIRELEGVSTQIKAGASLSKAIENLTLLPSFLVQMVKVGEESGRLDGVLTDIAHSYTQEIESNLKIITSLIEPLIILVLGLGIGAIVLSILLPIFQINMLIR